MAQRFVFLHNKQGLFTFPTPSAGTLSRVFTDIHNTEYALWGCYGATGCLTSNATTEWIDFTQTGLMLFLLKPEANACSRYAIL